MASHPLPSLSAFASIVTDLEPAQPLAGARIACTLPRTAASDILIAALERLGGEVHRAGTSAANGLLVWPNQAGPTLLLEHGAALSRLIHAGTRAEGRNGVPAHRAQPYSAIATAILGSTEVTAAGARVIFCSYFDALKTVSTGIAINCSRLRSPRSLGAGAAGSPATADARQIAAHHEPSSPQRRRRGSGQHKDAGGRPAGVEMVRIGWRDDSATHHHRHSRAGIQAAGNAITRSGLVRENALVSASPTLGVIRGPSLRFL